MTWLSSSASRCPTDALTATVAAMAWLLAIVGFVAAALLGYEVGWKRGVRSRRK